MYDVTNGQRIDKLMDGIIGVYALHLGNEIVYVGQAHCVKLRIKQHVQEGVKDFDGYSFASLTEILERMNYPTGKRYLDWVEAWEINRSKPEENRMIPNLRIMESLMPRKLLRFCRKVADQNGIPTDDDFSDLSLTDTVISVTGNAVTNNLCKKSQKSKTSPMVRLLMPFRAESQRSIL